MDIARSYNVSRKYHIEAFHMSAAVLYPPEWHEDNYRCR
jgi:hypothetical protein